MPTLRIVVAIKRKKNDGIVVVTKRKKLGHCEVSACITVNLNTYQYVNLVISRFTQCSYVV